MTGPIDPDLLLALLRDPKVETAEIAGVADVSREAASRAARLVHGIVQANAEEALALPAPLAIAVARAARDAGRADLLAALAAHPGKEASKEARRGLHVLRSRGVSVPDPAPPPRAPSAAPSPEPALPAYASAIDGQGERALWISRNVPGRGIEIAQAVLSDAKGLVDLRIALAGRKEWRTIVRELLEGGGALGVAEIEGATARSLAAAARALNDVSGERLPEGADLWLAQLGPAGPPPDPAAAFPPLPEAEEREALAASGELHDLPAFRGWIADEPFLRKVAARLDEVAVSPLYLDERQRAEQMARVLAEAVGGSLDGERRPLLSARLFAAAADLAARGDEAHARRAAAAARAMRAGTPAAEIPFARRLVEKAFPPAGPAAPSPAPPPSPLVVAQR